jgi:hypothetical protein
MSCRKYRSDNGQTGPSDISEVVSGPVFTKRRRGKHIRRFFVCIFKLEQSAQLDSTREVKRIYDVFALVVSTP